MPVAEEVVAGAASDEGDEGDDAFGILCIRDGEFVGGNGDDGGGDDDRGSYDDDKGSGDDDDDEDPSDDLDIIPLIMYHPIYVHTYDTTHTQYNTATRFCTGNRDG